MAVTPILDVERRFTVWKIDEIYTGPSGEGRNVPNVDDQVLDWNSGVYRVISVDHGKTNLSYMTRVNLGSLGGGIDDSDIAVITGPGANSNSFRVYIDTTVTPHTLAVDSRVIWNGPENAYIKIFKGTDTDQTTGKVVSAIVTTTGRISSENLPLTAVVVPNGTNVSVKAASTGFCSETLKDGDVVTIVTYTASGIKTSTDKFIVSTTNLVRSINQSEKYVTNIELITPFLSAIDKQLVECPINMITQSLNFSAKVSYSDGTSATTNIDGRKWNLIGLDTYVASQIGQVSRLMLTYTLGSSELAFDAGPELPDRKVIAEYRIKTVEVDTFYSVKLFVVPVWNSATRTYTLSWYLYNLERDDVVEVTNYVEYATTSPKFVGDRYSSTQTLQVAFNMQNLGQSYSYYRHVEVVAITLTNPGSRAGSNNFYNISYGDGLLYGASARALFSADTVNSGKLKLNLSCGYSDSMTWLTNIYRQLDPLYYEIAEPEAPLPSHARVIVGYGASAWQKDISINDITTDISNINYAITQGAQVRIELYTLDASNNKNHLALVSMVASAMT